MSIVTEEKQETPLPVVAQTRKARPARQPLSAFAHVALWPSVVRVLISIGGALALALTGFSQNIDIIVIGVFSSAILILLLARVRWAPILTIPMAAYLAYLTATQPYVLASLGNPYGSAGGFIKFVVVIVVLVCSLLMLGGCIGDAVLNYRPSLRKAPAWLPVACALVLGTGFGGLYVGAFSQAATPTGLTYTNGVPTVHVNQISFSQTSITIPKGSSLLLVDDTTIEHDLFNGSWEDTTPQISQEAGAPLVNNVYLAGGSSLTIGPFNVSGTYHILCMNHEKMGLTITVE